MDYKVAVTADAEEDLDQYIRYLLLVKKSEQAAKNVLDDFEATIQSLNNYFMMYRIVEDIVFVDNIFHELQDYENKMV